MAVVDISDELYSRLSAVSDDMDEFETTDEFVEYALASVAFELEQTTDEARGEHSEEAAEQRLKDLGYIR